MRRQLNIKNNFFLAIISGIVTAVSFPTVFGSFVLPNLGFLAWISLVPLFFAVKKSRPRGAFLLTFVSFLVGYGISLAWLFTALNTYGHLSPLVSVLVLVLLVVILSAYIALAPLFSGLVEKYLKVETFYTVPLFWTAVEFARNYFPCNGFPWGNITNTQYDYATIIQVVDITGIYGLTFLMIMVNWFVALLIFEIGEKKKTGIFVKGGLVSLLLVFVVVYGVYRINFIDNQQKAWPSIRAGLLQGNIAQEDKWQKGEEERNLEPYIKYTRALSLSDVDLIVWPEATYPWLIPLGEERLPPNTLGLDGVYEKNDPFILFGALSVAREAGERELFNSLILADKNGSIMGRYHKVHLVPFGEYVPFRKALFFAKKLVAPVGNFSAGEKIAPLFTDNYQIGGLVCYEDVFPEIARAEVSKGANLLAVVTNDSWYGRSSAAFQHLAISIFRTVENRRWMIKAANSGISAVVDAAGRMISGTGILEQGFIVSNVKLGGGFSIYTKIGDLFAWICAGISVLLVAMVGFKKLIK